MNKSNQNITVFKSITETISPFYLSIDDVLDRIKSGKSKDTVKLIRAETDKGDRNIIKKRLPSICFSGKFTSRADNAITEHSGFVCLDFDGYTKKKDVMEAKERMTKNNYVYSVFTSPSGDGLKVLVKIPPDADNHVKYFNALKDYFNDDHFDTTSKNISRVCYESYDPLLYVNKNSSLWEEIKEDEHIELTKVDRKTIPITDETKIVEILTKWWEKKYPMITGERNHNAYVLARAFNDYGINKPLASYILNQYASSDFPIKEIDQTIDSAYRNTADFGTKYYEDKDRVDDVRSMLKRGTPRHEIKEQLREESVDDETIDSVLEEAEVENAKKIFWTKNEKGVIRVIHFQFKEFLEENGFYKFCPLSSKNYVFVKVTDGLIDNTDEKEIKDFVLDHLIKIEDKSIYNYFADNTRFFKEEFLTLLGTIDVLFVEDSKDTSFMYYRNSAVKITKGSFETIDYVDLDGYVWKDHVIDRTFSSCDVTDSCDYRTFIKNICGGDKDRVKTMESTIGFLLHTHKAEDRCPSVILNDEVISDNPEGGTGKGLFMRALDQMKKVAVIDGKAFNFEKSFPYQTVGADTQILVFDDVKKYFDFERLFSVITEGITLEKKNKDAIKIPFSKSPKVAITTNYAIKGAGNSFERRKWELELHPYYSKGEMTPKEEFGRLMFSDWNDDDWCQFDNYMLKCLQGYLKTGLVGSKFVNLKIRRLSAETCHDFIEWCGLIEGSETTSTLQFDVKLYTNDCFDDFTQEYPDYAPRNKMSISRIKFNKWLALYAKHATGNPPSTGKDGNGKYIIIKQNKTEEVQTNLF